MNDANYVTVVYEIVDHEKWGVSNPLRYNHNGLEAVIVRRGNTVDELNKLEEKGIEL